MRAAWLWALCFGFEAVGAPYGWLTAPPKDSFEQRFTPPLGFKRVVLEPRSFGAWLRSLPLAPAGTPVQLFDGTVHPHASHLAVVDIDVGTKDLQQCADAVLRLWAEHQWSQAAAASLCVPLTNGEPVAWARWLHGERPRVEANRLKWVRAADGRPPRAKFRAYLDFVFAYAGTASMARWMVDPIRAADVRPGDVFLEGGSPGHAVLVVDVAENEAGERAFALAQSYMPAQSIHILRNPRAPASAWYVLKEGEALETPDWRFPPGRLRRLRAVPRRCEGQTKEGAR